MSSKIHSAMQCLLVHYLQIVSRVQLSSTGGPHLIANRNTANMGMKMLVTGRTLPKNAYDRIAVCS